MKGWLLLGSCLLGQAACLPPRGFPGILEDLPGGTAATVFEESSLLPQPSLSGVWTGSTAATILLSAFMELHTCKRVSANSVCQFSGIQPLHLLLHLVAKVPRKLEKEEVFVCLSV